jgi:hypothetical protein
MYSASVWPIVSFSQGGIVSRGSLLYPARLVQSGLHSKEPNAAAGRLHICLDPSSIVTDRLKNDSDMLAWSKQRERAATIYA